MHYVASIFEGENIDKANKWILKIDFANAFNNISRESMLKEVKLHCPKLSAWQSWHMDHRYISSLAPTISSARPVLIKATH